MEQQAIPFHPLANPQLWENINYFELDEPDASLSFTNRLARENNWTLEFAGEVVGEYKRFMYLICLSDRPLTPSDEVDQAWHLHLIYSQSYWDAFCRDILGRKIHHGPTKGGKSEGEKYNDAYEFTLQFYMEVFGYPPPETIWPDKVRRFSNINFQRVSVEDNWIIKKPKWIKKWMSKK